MIVYKKAKNKKEADRIQEFVEFKGYEAEVVENDGFMSDKYPFEVVGPNEKVLGLIERHEAIVNVVTNEQKRKSTWNKPKSEWGNSPKRIRT